MQEEEIAPIRSVVATQAAQSTPFKMKNRVASMNVEIFSEPAPEPVKQAPVPKCVISGLLLIYLSLI